MIYLLPSKNGGYTHLKNFTLYRWPEFAYVKFQIIALTYQEEKIRSISVERSTQIALLKLFYITTLLLQCESKTSLCITFINWKYQGFFCNNAKTYIVIVIYAKRWYFKINGSHCHILYKKLTKFIFAVRSATKVNVDTIILLYFILKKRYAEVNAFCCSNGIEWTSTSESLEWPLYMYIKYCQLFEWKKYRECTTQWDIKYYFLTYGDYNYS